AALATLLPFPVVTDGFVSLRLAVPDPLPAAEEGFLVRGAKDGAVAMTRREDAGGSPLLQSHRYVGQLALPFAPAASPAPPIVWRFSFPARPSPARTLQSRRDGPHFSPIAEASAAAGDGEMRAALKIARRRPLLDAGSGRHGDRRAFQGLPPRFRAFGDWQWQIIRSATAASAPDWTSPAW
ncbi:MAG TPA: hypothetical protein VK325_00340, partial [Pseudoxanthomonas sp.]|nr:hypothetical protein [Pseudoxanthomonas sp.]